jgi:hypothetical protein
MAGRKARCKKCGNTFRVPGGAARGSAGKTPPPGTLPDADEYVPMAVPVEETLPPPSETPAKGLAARPSADPFDLAGLPKPVPRPASGAVKSAPRPPSATPRPAAPAVPAKPAATPPPAKPQPEIYSLDDEPPTLEELPPDEPPAPGGAPETPAGARRRDEERDDRPRREERAEDEPRPKKKRREEREGRDEPRPRKKRERSEERDEPAPAAPGSNPFAFTAPAAEPERPAKKRRGQDEDEDDELEEFAVPPRRRRGSGGAGLVLLITGAVAFVAILLGIVAVVVYLNKTRPPEQTKEEQKEEPPPAAPTPEPRKIELPRVAPKPKESKPKEPKAPTLVLTPRTKTFAVGPPPAAPLSADRPKAGLVIDSPLAAVRRVFPPFDLQTGDKHVLVQLAAGAGGKGPALALDTYSASSDKRTGRIEYEGDARPAPVCDLHASIDGVRFLAAVGGRISVWNVDDGKKLHDAVDPYAGKPEHQKAGLAAAFFAADPNQVATVSTAGAVHLFDLRTRAATDEFVPRGAAAGKVALGRSAARAEGGSVVVVAGGVIYQVQAAPGLEVVRTYDLGGEAARSLALAASGTPGRVLYAFETDKKERAVAALPLGDAAELILYRWPEALGEPLGALWAAGGAGGVATASGVVWFDDDEGRFLPLVATQPAGPGLHFGDDRAYWYVVPHPTEPQKSALVALSVPFDDFSDFGKSYANGEPLRAVRIDHTGLAK